MRRVPNTYKVNLRTWRHWSPSARNVFNQTFRNLTSNWGWPLLAPEPLHDVPRRVRRVLAWNAAWLAADAADWR